MRSSFLLVLEWPYKRGLVGHIWFFAKNTSGQAAVYFLSRGQRPFATERYFRPLHKGRCLTPPRPFSVGGRACVAPFLAHRLCPSIRTGAIDGFNDDVCQYPLCQPT